MKNKYLIITHSWFSSSSYGFSVREVIAESEIDAYNQGLILLGKHDPFNNKDFAVVELEPSYQLKRKLTWKERILGKLMNESI